MPQRTTPGGSKKKKGRAPKHQNSFAFRHNPKSKKTDKILNSPNVGVCRRCHDKIEWRKKYRKYKPRTQLGKCNLCCGKNIKAAYHTICTECAGGDRAIADMEKRRVVGGGAAVVQPTGEKDVESPTTDGEEPTSTDDNDATSNPVDQTAIRRARRRLRVCAMCASEPALSKHSYGDGEDEDLIEDIHLLEDKIEDGVSDDGKKLTLREIKSLERKIEKLQLEMKERRKARENKDDDEEEEEGNEDDSSDGGDGEEADSVQLGDVAEEQDNDDDANDPFLQAIGGKDKLLVGEEYQKMLLAQEQQS
eukprot:scaffold10294_cov102-Skeletonema_dohrnii-CCMP3373.AAC.6